MPPHLDQVEAARRRLLAVTRYRDLLAMRDGDRRVHSSVTAAEIVRSEGHRASRVSLGRWLRDFDAGGPDALLSDHDNCGRRPAALPLTPSDVSILEERYLRTNHDRDHGSLPEAARSALGDGLLSPAAAEALRARIDSRARELIPRSIARRIAAPASVIHAARSPGDANLRYSSTRGSIRRVFDEAAGDYRLMRAGDVGEADDGTINLIVCLPREGGSPCSDKFGVEVGRWQWLPWLDVGTSMVLGYGYSARPRGSYRAEDILALMLRIFSGHGLPQRCRFERGIWESASIKRALNQLQVGRWKAYTPQQKLIESRFRKFWTQLSVLPGQIGRFRGEMEQENDLYTRARRGTLDPRDHFPALATVLDGFDRAIKEGNETPIHSPSYGSWVPRERWEAQRGEGRLRPFDPATAWLFSPLQRQLTVRGNSVATTVAIADGWSAQYSYQAAWLPEFDRARIVLYCDPFGVDPTATIVLDQDWGDRRKGDVLGSASQVDEGVRRLRSALRWGIDPDRGRDINRDTRRALAHEVTRITRAIAADGAIASTVAEKRGGDGRAEKIEITGPAEAPAVVADAAVRPARRRIDLPEAPTPEQYADDRALRRRLAAARSRVAAPLSVAVKT